MAWETRYSSSEMGYLEVLSDRIVFYLNRRGPSEDSWTFDEVLAGDADYMLNGVFSATDVEEMKAEVRRRKSGSG
jgi:hypothetical protein